MDSSQRMNTLSQILELLRVQKKDKEFVMTEEGFTPGNKKYYQPEELTIIKTYRFEGDSNPSDMCALYVIEASDGLIGYSIDAYGAYSNHDNSAYDDFIKKVPVEDRTNVL